jgi:hypothetical protein
VADGRRRTIERHIVAVMLKPGDKAPDFTLLDQDGNPFALSKIAEGQEGMALDLLLPEDVQAVMSGLRPATKSRR